MQTWHLLDVFAMEITNNLVVRAKPGAIGRVSKFCDKIQGPQHVVSEDLWMQLARGWSVIWNQSLQKGSIWTGHVVLRKLQRLLPRCGTLTGAEADTEPAERGLTGILWRVVGRSGVRYSLVEASFGPYQSTIGLIVYLNVGTTDTDCKP